jgi:hypothetical protein
MRKKAVKGRKNTPRSIRRIAMDRKIRFAMFMDFAPDDVFSNLLLSESRLMRR